MPRNPRVRWALAVLPLALVAAACGSDDDPEPVGSPTTAGTVAPGPTSPTSVATTTPTAGQVVTASFRGGRVEGPGRQRVPLNQPVILRVTSDVVDEVHVHAYEKKAPVGPGQLAEIAFVANIPGVFEVELELTHRLLFTLEVR